MAEREKHIVVIDGNVDVLCVIERILAGRGFRVTGSPEISLVNNVTEEGWHPDLFIVDAQQVDMMDEKQWNRLLQNVPVLWLGSHFSEKIEAFLAQHDEQEVLTKPFNMDQLLYKVESLLK